VDKFYYFGDMLSVDGDADAAVENRIQIQWNKFRQLVPLFTNKDISLKVRGRLCSGCKRSRISEQLTLELCLLRTLQKSCLIEFPVLARDKVFLYRVF